MSEELGTALSPETKMWAALGLVTAKTIWDFAKASLARWNAARVKKAEQLRKDKQRLIRQARRAKEKATQQVIRELKKGLEELKEISPSLATKAETAELKAKAVQLTTDLTDLARNCDANIAEEAKRVDDTVAGMDRTLERIGTQVQNVASTTDHIRGSISEVTKTLDNRFEKQGNYYRDEVAKIRSEVDGKLVVSDRQIRQDFSRMVADAVVDRRKK